MKINVVINHRQTFINKKNNNKKKKQSENSNKKTGDDPSLASCKPFHYDTKTFNMSILSQTYRPK